MLNIVYLITYNVEIVIFASFKFNLIFIFTFMEQVYIVEFVFDGNKLFSNRFFTYFYAAVDYANSIKEKDSKVLSYNILHFIKG